MSYGPMPWNPEFFEKYRAVNKSYKERSGVSNRLLRRDGNLVSSGWRPAYQTNIKDASHWERVQLADGTVHMVPKADYMEYFNFYADNHVPPDIIEYISTAFVEREGRSKYVEVACPQGCHIDTIKYNATKQLMSVSFRNNGAVITCFRVPKEVYAELEQEALNGTVSMGHDLKARHLVGIRFWDLMRIRGSRYGMRYQFTYSVEGAGEAAPNIEPETS